MRIVFMGTPDFAEASLQKLIDEHYAVAGVFTQPDRPRGRGMELSFSPVKSLALAHNIPVFQPEKLRDGWALTKLKELQPDILVVVAYGKILPDDMLALPRYGAINVHASLLPKYRGAAPIQWAILNGDKQTGVSIMYLAHEMDSGDIIMRRETEIGEKETAGELFERLKHIGAQALVDSLRAIENGTAPRQPQNEAEATYVHMLDKSMSPIDWAKSARQVCKQIFGLQPWPVATMELSGTTLRVFDAERTEERTALAPGSVVEADERGIAIACGKGEIIRVTQVQAPGKKRMSAAEYLRGHPIDGVK